MKFVQERWSMPVFHMCETTELCIFKPSKIGIEIMIMIVASPHVTSRRCLVLNLGPLQAGFTDVTHLEGGLNQWRYDGLPTIRSDGQVYRQERKAKATKK